MVDLIIPIHNIQKRGFFRIYNSLVSLSLQKENIDKVVIVNSSENSQIEAIKPLINFPFVKHIVFPQPYFNKPKLFQEGLKHCDSEYVFLTDCDYMFSKDLLESAKRLRGNNLIHKRVLNTRTGSTIGPLLMNKWRFRSKSDFGWGTLANGGMQYARRSFFEEVIKEVPEFLEMEGWGAMDNIMTYIAHNKGLDIVWMDEGEILHQWHKAEKWQTPEDKQRFYKNQEILHAYIAKYNLPTLLSKDA